MTVETRSLAKLEGVATAFRVLVTAGAALLAFAILAGVTDADATASAVLLLIVAIAAPIVHGVLAIALRDGWDKVLEGTLAATGLLLVLDLVTTTTLSVQDVLSDDAWAYITTAVLIVVIHVAVLVQAGRGYADQRAHEATEAEPEADEEIEDAEPS